MEVDSAVHALKRVNISSMNIETKLEHFYKPEKMRTAIFKME